MEIQINKLKKVMKMNNQIKVTEKTEITEDGMKTFILNQLLATFKIYEDEMAKTEANFLSLIATLSTKLDEMSDTKSAKNQTIIDTYRQSARLSNEIVTARVILKDLETNLQRVADELTVKDYYYMSISSKKGEVTSTMDLTLSTAEPFNSNEEDYRQFIDNSIEVLQSLKSKLDNKEGINNDSSSFH